VHEPENNPKESILILKNGLDVISDAAEAAVELYFNMALNVGAANQLAYISSLGENRKVTDNVKGPKNRKNFCLFGLNPSKTGLIDLFLETRGSEHNLHISCHGAG
jgi:hypothetical protein